MLAGASTVFFAYIGFDAVSANAEVSIDFIRFVSIPLLHLFHYCSALDLEQHASVLFYCTN